MSDANTGLHAVRRGVHLATARLAEQLLLLSPPTKQLLQVASRCCCCLAQMVVGLGHKAVIFLSDFSCHILSSKSLFLNSKPKIRILNRILLLKLFLVKSLNLLVPKFRTENMFVSLFFFSRHLVCSFQSFRLSTSHSDSFLDKMLESI